MRCWGADCENLSKFFGNCAISSVGYTCSNLSMYPLVCLNLLRLWLGLFRR
jgi:hypothetical protein